MLLTLLLLDLVIKLTKLPFIYFAAFINVLRTCLEISGTCFIWWLLIFDIAHITSLLLFFAHFVTNWKFSNLFKHTKSLMGSILPYIIKTFLGFLMFAFNQHALCLWNKCIFNFEVEWMLLTQIQSCRNISYNQVQPSSQNQNSSEISMMLENLEFMDLILWCLPATYGG